MGLSELFQVMSAAEPYASTVVDLLLSQEIWVENQLGTYFLYKFSHYPIRSC